MSEATPKSDRTLDAKGMKCPLPVLRARKAMKEVPPGGTLEVLATDPSAPQDFVSFCETTGHELLENRQDGDHFVLRIRKVG
ncbi:sulfurtransferase TusA family protein [Algihabitans albus]|uniref:sulfurtransferase TusA family protein n=1 Tax=Algihabitans albus TaxID=2164067 RepID=UPI000E5C67DF|nr:sulfurtransferase TusA family protein [Algihabitans albus]